MPSTWRQTVCSNCSELTFFRAPENIDATCSCCGERILPDEIVADFEMEVAPGRTVDAYIHEACVTEE